MKKEFRGKMKLRLTALKLSPYFSASTGHSGQSSTLKPHVLIQSQTAMPKRILPKAFLFLPMNETIPSLGYYFDKYLPLHKKTFTIKGERFLIHAEKTLAIYPYKHWQTRVDIENLTTESAYRFESMENEETFCKFSDKLEKMLSTARI